MPVCTGLVTGPRAVQFWKNYQKGKVLVEVLVDLQGIP
jgi:hypothetical protein